MADRRAIGLPLVIGGAALAIYAIPPVTFVALAALAFGVVGIVYGTALLVRGRGSPRSPRDGDERN